MVTVPDRVDPILEVRPIRHGVPLFRLVRARLALRSKERVIAAVVRNDHVSFGAEKNGSDRKVGLHEWVFVPKTGLAIGVPGTVFIRDQRMIDILEEEHYDYVVDAIDTLSPKVFLIYHSLRLKLRIVSSMGAGGRYDPAAVRVADISETNFCNLARMLRKKLHKLGVHEGFLAVYSPEVVDKNLIVRGSDESNKASSVGTMSYMPAVFGLVCASVVIRELAGIPVAG